MTGDKVGKCSRPVWRPPFLFLGITFSCALLAHSSAEPLPSWNDGPAKSAIVRFVNKVTKHGSADFVQPTERIAVFDNDGTLWAEQPVYFQLLFTFDRVKQLAPQHPEWQTNEPFASVLQNNKQRVLASGVKGMLDLFANSQSGLTTDEFEKSVKDWLSTGRHPKTGQPFTNMVYRPMVEVLEYLRSNGFKTFVITGGSAEFVRPWAELVYGVPPEQVVGSTTQVHYELRDGKPVFVRDGELGFMNDKAGKPLAILNGIGRRPIFAFGNSDGDFEMLEWTTSGAGVRFGGLVHHTDSKREWAYDRQSQVGRLVRGLDEGPKRGWLIVDMAKDWNRVFAWEQTSK